MIHIQARSLGNKHMTITTKTTKTLECDCCKVQVDYTKADFNPPNWGTLTAQTAKPRPGGITDQPPFHYCPTCWPRVQLYIEQHCNFNAGPITPVPIDPLYAQFLKANKIGG